MLLSQWLMPAWYIQELKVVSLYGKNVGGELHTNLDFVTVIKQVVHICDSAYFFSSRK